MRPRGRRANMDAWNRAGPTWSNTMSTPRPPVAPRADDAHGARPAVQGRVHHDPVADPYPVDARAQGRDLAGHVETGDVRQGESRDQRWADALLDVEAVERRGLDGHEGLTVAGHRIGNVDDVQDVGAAALGLGHRPHAMPRSKGWARAARARWRRGKHILASRGRRSG